MKHLLLSLSIFHCFIGTVATFAHAEEKKIEIQPMVSSIIFKKREEILKSSALPLEKVHQLQDLISPKDSFNLAQYQELNSTIFNTSESSRQVLLRDIQGLIRENPGIESSLDKEAEVFAKKLDALLEKNPTEIPLAILAEADRYLPSRTGAEIFQTLAEYEKSAKRPYKAEAYIADQKDFSLGSLDDGSTEQSALELLSKLNSGNSCTIPIASSSIVKTPSKDTRWKSCRMDPEFIRFVSSLETGFENGIPLYKGLGFTEMGTIGLESEEGFISVVRWGDRIYLQKIDAQKGMFTHEQVGQKEFPPVLKEYFDLYRTYFGSDERHRIFTYQDLEMRGKFYEEERNRLSNEHDRDRDSLLNWIGSAGSEKESLADIHKSEALDFILSPHEQGYVLYAENSRWEWDALGRLKKYDSRDSSFQQVPIGLPVCNREKTKALLLHFFLQTKDSEKTSFFENFEEKKGSVFEDLYIELLQNYKKYHFSPEVWTELSRSGFKMYFSTDEKKEKAQAAVFKMILDTGFSPDLRLSFFIWFTRNDDLSAFGEESRNLFPKITEDLIFNVREEPELRDRALMMLGNPLILSGLLTFQNLKERIESSDHLDVRLSMLDKIFNTELDSNSSLEKPLQKAEDNSQKKSQENSEEEDLEDKKSTNLLNEIEKIIIGRVELDSDEEMRIQCLIRLLESNFKSAAGLYLKYLQNVRIENLKDEASLRLYFSLISSFSSYPKDTPERTQIVGLIYSHLTYIKPLEHDFYKLSYFVSSTSEDFPKDALALLKKLILDKSYSIEGRRKLLSNLFKCLGQESEVVALFKEWQLNDPTEFKQAMDTSNYNIGILEWTGILDQLKSEYSSLVERMKPKEDSQASFETLTRKLRVDYRKLAKHHNDIVQMILAVFPEAELHLSDPELPEVGDLYNEILSGKLDLERATEAEKLNPALNQESQNGP